MENASKHLLLQFKAVCDQHAIEYVIDGGTLIGSMLHHGRIPWDDDLDVYVRVEDRTKALRVLNRDGHMAAAVEGGMYAKFWQRDKPAVKNAGAYRWNRQWPYIDIGWLDANMTHTWELRATHAGPSKYRHHVYPRALLFPPVLRPYGDLMLSAPRDAERLLTGRLGPKWRETCVLANYDHRRSRILDPSIPDADGKTLIRCSALAQWLPLVGLGPAGQETLYVHGHPVQHFDPRTCALTRLGVESKTVRASTVSRSVRSPSFWRKIDRPAAGPQPD